MPVRLYYKPVRVVLKNRWYFCFVGCTCSYIILWNFNWLQCRPGPLLLLVVEMPMLQKPAELDVRIFLPSTQNVGLLGDKSTSLWLIVRVPREPTAHMRSGNCGGPAWEATKLVDEFGPAYEG